MVNPAAERPHLNSNFLVDLGERGADVARAGFCAVEFPEFRLDPAEASDSRDVRLPHQQTDGGIESRHLILRRGVSGALDLYAWWDKTRRGKAPRQRTVKVSLLGPDHATIVLTWIFRRARPVSLSYSPLNALEGAVLIETIELDYESMEMR
jgi:phage tail-like protein